MKKVLFAFGMLLLTSGSAFAGGLVTKHSSSLQITVDAARTQATRIGSSYSVSGSGVTTDVGGSGTADLNVGGLAVSTGVGTYGGTGNAVTATQKTDGASFSYAQSYTQGDAIPTSAVTAGSYSAFSNQTSYAAGSAGSGTGAITAAHGITGIAGGGSGSTVTGQFVSEITVID